MQEQDVYMKMLLKQAKEFEKRLDEEEVTDKGEVIKIMMDKWEAKKQQDEEVAGVYVFCISYALCLVLKLYRCSQNCEMFSFSILFSSIITWTMKCVDKNGC